MSVKKKPLVVVTRKLPDSIETRMRELFDATMRAAGLRTARHQHRAVGKHAGLGTSARNPDSKRVVPRICA